MPSSYTVRSRQSRLSPTRTLPNILGRGVAFPVRRADTGGLLQAEGEELVQQSIIEIINTDLGEGIRAFFVRSGRLYGTRLRRYLFESIEQVRELAGYEVREALEVWEPRIIVSAVNVLAPLDATTENGRKTVHINPVYVLRATNKRVTDLFVPVAMRTVQAG